MIAELLLTLLSAQAQAPGADRSTPGSAEGQEGAAQSAPAPATMLRLRSGEFLFGSIAGHDETGLRFRRLETGGELQLPWSFLDPEESARMRLELGYVESEAEELLVDADRIELANGTEIIGRIVNRTEDHLWIKRAEGTVPIAKTLVKGAVTAVRAPALDLYTKEELYQQKAFEMQGLLAQEGRTGARAHDELAQFAERLLDYPHALEHYREAQERDPTYDSSRLALAATRAEEKAALQEQVDYLSEIDLMRARRRYDKAVADLEAFPRLYPGSPLQDDWNKLRARVAKSQERDLRSEIIRLWNYYAVRLAREAARKKSYEEVVDYLDEQMSEDVVDQVREQVQSIAPGIESDQVRRLWSERKGGPYRTATYGLGTWILGESARQELDQRKEKPAAEEPEKGSQAAEGRKIEERIKRYLENQKLTRAAQQSQSEEDDPAVFWQGWGWSGRAQWVLAYYAEKSGDFRDLQSRFEPCRECGGTGAREVLYTGSAMQNAKAGQQLVPCPACHTIGIVRRIRYR